jgi:signal transduction histidine kinase
MSESEALREVEEWIARVRLGAVVFALLEVLVFTPHYPPGREAWGLGVALVFAVGAVAIFVANRRGLDVRRRRVLSGGAMLLDTVVVVAFVFVYAYEPGTQTREALFFLSVEAALRWGLRGGIGISLALLPVLVAFERYRSHRYPPHDFISDNVSFPFGLLVIVGAIVGWLVGRMRVERARAESRAGEAEWLRDRLGQRADLLDAAKRCARALSSSLELDEASTAFIRELRGLVPFDRMAIVLAEDGVARVLATSGESAETSMPPGTALSLENNILAEVVTSGQTAYRPDMSEPRYDEEPALVDIGVRSRVVVPLPVGGRTIGVLSIGRGEIDAFTEDEIELVTLLGRLVAGAVQNIRAYEAERRTVDELRRLSALRADFVSLVSHDLRSPMATVIGSARTLQQHWRELKPEQRDSFIALIADETSRLASLISDVLETSRIESGTFSFAFRDVDVGTLVRDAAAVAGLAQNEVPIEAEVHGDLSGVRADPERLRQALTNLIENAVKWSPHGTPVAVVARATNGVVRIDVRDSGPGIPSDQQRVIFEKFGRADVGGRARPGTGLGLYIARSILEAHGGSLELASTVGRGSTFTIVLPARTG